MPPPDVASARGPRVNFVGSRKTLAAATSAMAKALEGVDLEEVGELVDILEKDEEALERYGDLNIREAPRVLRELRERAPVLAGPIVSSKCVGPRSRGTSRAPRSRRVRTSARSHGPPG